MATATPVRLVPVALSAVLGCLVSWKISARPSNSIPAHLRHDAIVLPDLIDETSFQELRSLVRQLGADGYPVNTNDLKSYVTEHEHIGEAEPIGEDGRCADVFMVPSVNRSHCILPGRLDIGKHYIMTGGAEALKEGAPALTARALSFGKYMFDLSQYAVVDRLFSSDKFQQAALSICPAHTKFLDPFQFNFIIQVPGQTVPLHVDGVYFWGATRFQFPQWLLAVMLWSNRFADKFVHQVQVVGYLHEHVLNTSQVGGEFIWWGADGQPRRSAPVPRSGNVVDGSKTVHAALAYMRERGAPPIDKNADVVLKYAGGTRWELRALRTNSERAASTDTSAAAKSDDGRELVRTYEDSELRISIVYRARCFEDESRARAFRELLHAPPGTAGRMSLKDVLAVLRDDIAARGSPIPEDASRYDVAMRLLRAYIKYPMPPDAWLPYNHCALAGLLPSLKPILRNVCNGL